MRVPITEVHGVVPAKLVIAFDNVLEFAVLRCLVRAQVIEANCVCARTTGDIPGYREEITEGRNAVDREVFDVEGIRDSKLVRSQECYPDVANCVRPFDVTGDVVKARIEGVGLPRRWCRRKSRYPRIPVNASESFVVNRIRSRPAINYAARNVQLLVDQRVNAGASVVNAAPCWL